MSSPDYSHYIKFHCEWSNASVLSASNVEAIAGARDECVQLSLIGMYPDGIGFGNISQRLGEDGEFIVSGTATGDVRPSRPEIFTTVKSVNLARNSLSCEGPLKASSESMSHFVIYETLPEVKAIIHAHHRELWKAVLHKIPTTAESISYGTPEMASAIVQLLEPEKGTKAPFASCFAMAGHEEGLFFYGASFTEVLVWLRAISFEDRLRNKKAPGRFPQPSALFVYDLTDYCRSLWSLKNVASTERRINAPTATTNRPSAARY